MIEIVEHYRSEGLTARILKALGTAGSQSGAVDPDLLAGVDEFHLGGRVMTDEIIKTLAVANPREVLDVGSGIGGMARTLAGRLGCDVTGVDLTPEFVATANELTELVGLDSSVAFQVGSATALPFDDGSFDAVTLLHVGMNIADKASMASELARVLGPGGVLALFDVMRIGLGEVEFPMPWASSADTSFVDTPEAYVEVLTAAGFDVGEPEDQTELVIKVMDSVAGRPPAPVNLGLVMGKEFPTMIANVVRALKESIWHQS